MPENVELHHRREKGESFKDVVPEGETAKFQVRITLSADEVKAIESKSLYWVKLKVDHRDTETADFESITVRESTTEFGDAFDINVVKDDITYKDGPNGEKIPVAVINVDLKTYDDTDDEDGLLLAYESFGLSIVEVDGKDVNVTTFKRISDNDKYVENIAFNFDDNDPDIGFDFSGPSNALQGENDQIVDRRGLERETAGSPTTAEKGDTPSFQGLFIEPGINDGIPVLETSLGPFDEGF